MEIQTLSLKHHVALNPRELAVVKNYFFNQNKLCLSLSIEKKNW